MGNGSPLSNCLAGSSCPGLHERDKELLG
uniref:Uncharacterized protein n=1 Tax=Anguilla anguilla TaxID=7936 RepID=A0A0E9TMR4_ANGAN